MGICAWCSMAKYCQVAPCHGKNILVSLDDDVESLNVVSRDSRRVKKSYMRRV